MRFNYKQRGRARIQAMISIWLLISISLLVLAIAGSMWVTRVVSGYAVQNYQANVESVVHLFDREITQLETIAAQLSSTDWVRRIMFMQGAALDKTRVSDFSLYENLQQIRTFKQTNSLITEIGVLFFEKDLVIASYGKSDFRFLAENAMLTEDMTQADWQNLYQLLSFTSVHKLDDINICKYGVPSRGTLLIYPLQDGTTSRVSAAMFVFVPHSGLSKYIEPLLLETGAQESAFKLFSKDAQTPFLTHGELTNTNTRSLISESEKTGWRFVIEIPESIVLTSATNFRNTLLIVVAGMWLVSMLIVPVITRRLFFPIERIMGMFAGENTSRFIDEYDAILNGIERLRQQHDELKAELVQRQPMARAACLQTLLTNKNIQSTERNKLLGVLGIMDFPKYCVCMLLPMQGTAREPDINALEQISAQQESRVVAGWYNAVPIALLCVRDKQGLQALVAAILEYCPDIYVILGELVEGADKLTEALKTALAARDYRIVSEGFRVQRYDSALLKKGGYYLPGDAEYRLLQAIRNGNAAPAIEVFEDLYRHNAAQDGTTYASLRNFLFNIQLDMVKLLREGNFSDASVPQWEGDIALETAYSDIVECIGHAAGQYQERIKATPTRLEDIKKYIKANLYDNALSLTMVADAFGVSNSLVSRLFSELGENFLSYVNRLRIEHACACLRRDPQIDILTVARMAGYDNDVTFRRVFKKYVGLTPSQYREQNSFAG